MIVFLFLLALCLIYLWKDTRKPNNFPPGPTWLPIVGCIPVLRTFRNKFKYHHLMWQYFSHKYGDVTGFRIGREKLIVVSGVDAIKEFYQNDAFNCRPNGFFFKIRTFNKRLGIVFADGQDWEIHRKFSGKVLKQLRMGKSSSNHIELEAAEMVNYFKTKVSSKALLEMQHIFDIPVLNIIWSLLSGYRFCAEDDNCLHLLKLVHESFRVIDMSGGILNQFPFIRYIFPKLSGYKKLIETTKPLWKFLNEKIAEIHSNLNSNEDSSSFIESFLKQMAKNKSEIFSTEQLLSVCVDFFQAGSETTSNTLGFAIIYMLHYPTVLKKVRNELDKVVGRNNLPKLKHKSMLPYSEAVINEIQRITNVAPMGIAHRVSNDSKFRGYKLPKDTIALISLYSSSMDKNYWKDPHVFKPERFLDSKTGKFIQCEYFFPFGLGKRRCVGEDLAKSSLFIFFTSFCNFFDVELHGSSLPDVQGIDGITISPPKFSGYLKLRK